MLETDKFIEFISSTRETFLAELTAAAFLKLLPLKTFATVSMILNSMDEAIGLIAARELA